MPRLGRWSLPATSSTRPTSRRRWLRPCRRWPGPVPWSWWGTRSVPCFRPGCSCRWPATTLRSTPPSRRPTRSRPWSHWWRPRSSAKGWYRFQPGAQPSGEGGPVEILTEKAEMGVVEQRFDLTVAGEVVPGIRWWPEGAGGPRPTILIGHGGTQHKRVPNVLGLARRFVRHLGYSAVAIDAPGHGDRVTDPAAAEEARRHLEAQIAAGPGRGSLALGPEQAKAWVERTSRGVTEWKATLDALVGAGLADHRVGYWGVSMGTAIGLPYVAADPRVRAAVLGLAGLSNRPGAAAFEAAARSLTVPVLFVYQWDDELMSRQSGLDLFDAIGSADKAMHIHPGGHVGTPLYERDAYEAFFRRHLSS